MIECHHCGSADVVAQIATTAVSADHQGAVERYWLCRSCVEAEQRRNDAIVSDVHRRIADGSLVEQLRQQLAPIIEEGDETKLAEIAEYLALIRNALPTGLPADLETIVVRSRRPAV